MKDLEKLKDDCFQNATKSRDKLRDFILTGASAIVFAIIFAIKSSELKLCQEIRIILVIFSVTILSCLFELFFDSKFLYWRALKFKCLLRKQNVRVSKKRTVNLKVSNKKEGKYNKIRSLFLYSSYISFLVGSLNLILYFMFKL